MPPSAEMSKSEERYDVVVIGAGIHGLCAAHTFLKIQPSLRLILIDDKPSIGGTWSKEQLYPHLRANSLQGYLEFSDFPILEAGLGVEKEGVLLGSVMNAYFEKYAAHFDVTRRVRLNTRVVSATEQAGDPLPYWTLTLTSVSSQSQAAPTTTTISCSKLVVATGVTSRPLIPRIPGAEDFQRPIFHMEDMGRSSAKITEDPAVKHVTVIGGSKSAHDAAYLCVKAGKRVTMFIRGKGKGGTPMMKPYAPIGPWLVYAEKTLLIRQLSWFAPCPWDDAGGFGWIRRLLHQTSIGRWLVRGFYGDMGDKGRAASGILEDERSKVLVPDGSLYWYGTQTNCLNYGSDFYSHIRDGSIDVVRDEIHHLENGRIVFDSGSTLSTDAIVLATGYELGPTLPFKPLSGKLDMGIPVPPSEDIKFPELESRADAELLQTYPELANAPPMLRRWPETTPWRLWRFIAPPAQVCAPSGHRNIVFFNAVVAIQTLLKAEVTSLWAYAYLFDSLSVHPADSQQVTYEAVLWSRFGWWHRRLGSQGKIGDLSREAIPYYDRLISDLGLRVWRKGGFLQELFGGWYNLSDYRGLVDEWIAKEKKRI